ncbi:MAG: PAS domain-containing protein [candidate division Zixibacteria bacterium]|nr:PAS domain-containing protein [candidate division Zixibacteria bacterium]
MTKQNSTKDRSTAYHRDPCNRRSDTLRDQTVFNRIMETSPVGIVVLDRDGVILTANERAEEILGLSRSEIAGRQYDDFQWVITDFDGNLFPSERLPFSVAKNTGKPVYDVRHAIMRPDGKRVLLSINAAPLTDNAGRVDGMVMSVEDVTERVRITDKLRESENQFEQLIKVLPMGLHQYRLAENGRLIFEGCNDCADKMLGISHQAFIGRTIEEAFPPLANSELPEQYRRVVREGKIWQAEQVVYEDNLISGAYHVVAFPTMPGKMAALFLDITDRKKAEQALRASEQEKATILESVSELVSFQDRDLRVIWANRAGAESVNATLDELIGRRCHEIWNHRTTPCPDCPVLLALETGQPQETEMTSCDGRVWWIRGYPVRNEQGELVGVVEVTLNITERKQAQDALLESKRRYQELFDSVMEGIGLLNADESIEFANPAFAKIFESAHPSEIVGKSLLDFVDGDQRKIWMQDIERRRTGGSSQYEIDIRTACGNPRSVYVSITPRFDENKTYIGALCSILDITELRRAEEHRKKLQEKLERAERMESLGMLAGGVAHDLNNMLGPLVGYPELILAKLPENSPVRRQVQRIENAARSAADVIQDLLTLARRGRYDMVATDINDVVRSYLDSANFQKLLDTHPDVKPVINLDDTIGRIHGSAAHLSKVIMNLVVNAFDAMPDGGAITIETSQRHIDRLYGGHDKIESGEYVVFKARDTGVGIEPHELEKIFEPYYSRKKMGNSGSGLGLAVVYSIVKDHRGFYDVFSVPHQGTEFVLYFPVSHETVVRENTEANDVSGSETLLVVDDLEEQRDIAAEILESLGYRVHTAVNGQDAITFLQSHTVDLVVLDMIMGDGFDGLDTYREIIKKHPGQKAIIVSGFSATDRVNAMQKLGAGTYVKKPYTRQALGQAVRSELDRIVQPTVPNPLSK